MSAATSPRTRVDAVPQSYPAEVTLLDLVRTIGEITNEENEIVATVVHMIRSGRVRLRGNFRGSNLSDI